MIEPMGLTEVEKSRLLRTYAKPGLARPRDRYSRRTSGNLAVTHEPERKPIDVVTPGLLGGCFIGGWSRFLTQEWPR
jgi:hypothetical protein